MDNLSKVHFDILTEEIKTEEELIIAPYLDFEIKSGLGILLYEHMLIDTRLTMLFSHK